MMREQAHASDHANSEERRKTTLLIKEMTTCFFTELKTVLLEETTS
jgi:hypothetical protein